jgi:uncharacterized protein involved in exopolysaccharide biosynthesis
MEETQNTSIDPLKVFWSRKWALLLFTLIATGTAVFAGSFLPKQYESKATVLLSPPMFNSEKQKSFFSIDSYRDLAKTSGVLQGVIDRLKSQYPNIQKTLYPKILEGMISIDTGAAKFTGAESKSALMSFRVRGRDPILLRDIANTLTTLLSEESRKMRANEIATISRVTQAQYISTKDALGKLEQTFQKAKANNHLDSVLANLLIKQVNLKHFEMASINTQVELIEEESKLSSLTTQSKKHSDLVIESLLKTQINNESLVAKQKFLANSIAQLKKEIPQLEDKVLQMELQEEQLERQVDTLKDSFTILAKRLEEIRISESEKTSDMRLISQAIEPHFPIWPNRVKIILITLVLSLVVGMAAALSKEHLDNVS